MKIEFHPVFRPILKLSVVWPKIRDMFKGFTLNPESYAEMIKRVIILILGVVAVVAAIVIALKLL